MPQRTVTNPRTKLRVLFDLVGSELYDALESLDGPDLVEVVREELAQPLVALRTAADLHELETGRNPVATTPELALQRRLFERGYLARDGAEAIPFREFPLFPATEGRGPRADLVVFHRDVRLPEVIELKPGDAKDSLAGVVIQILYYWTFLRRHFGSLRQTLRVHDPEMDVSESSHQPLAAIAAPRRFFEECQRKSRIRMASNPSWDDLAAAALIVGCLQANFDLHIRLLEIDDDWETNARALVIERPWHFL